MLIKDEFYVAHLLTSFEKRRRDRQRYNVNPAIGDRLRYRRTFHPRMLGRQVDIPIPHWALYVLRNLRPLRCVMPWHRLADRRFLRWYEQTVDGFSFTDEVTYERYLEALRCPEGVAGYAEIRRPKVQAARHRADQILADLSKARAARRDKLAI